MSFLDEAFEAIGEFFGVASTVESRIGGGAGYATGYVAGYVLGGAVRARATASFGASVGASVLQGGWNADRWLPVVQYGTEPELTPTGEQQREKVASADAATRQLTGVTTGEVVPGYIDELPGGSGGVTSGDSASLEQLAGAAASSTPEQSKAVAAQSTSEQKLAAEASGRGETAAFMGVLSEPKYAGAIAEWPPSEAELRRLARLYAALSLSASAMESLLFPEFPEDHLVFKNPSVRDAEPAPNGDLATPTSPPVDETLLLDGSTILGRPPPFSDTLQKMYGGESSDAMAESGGEPLPIGAIVGEQPPAVTTVEPSASPTAPAKGATSPGFTGGATSAALDGSGSGGAPPSNEVAPESPDSFTRRFDELAPKGSWQRGALKGVGTFIASAHPAGQLYLFWSGAYDRLTDPKGVSFGSLADFYLGHAHPLYQLVKTGIAAEEAWTSNNDEAIAEIGTQTILSLVLMLLLGRAIGPGGAPGKGALLEGAAGEGALSEGALSEGAAGEGALSEGALSEGAAGEGALSEGEVVETGEESTESAIAEEEARPGKGGRLGSFLPSKSIYQVTRIGEVPAPAFRGQVGQNCIPYSLEAATGTPEHLIEGELIATGKGNSSTGYLLEDAVDANNSVAQRLSAQGQKVTELRYEYEPEGSAKIDLMVNATDKGPWIAGVTDGTGAGVHAVAVMGETSIGEVIIVDPAGSPTYPGVAVTFRLSYADFLDVWTGESAFPRK